MKRPMPRPCGVRRGMTLVELLVVTGLIAMFLGLVVVGVGGRQSQQRAAETLAAVLSSAQSRALGAPAGAAAILASGSGSEPNAAAACTSLYDGVMLPFVEATASGPMAPDSPAASVTVTPTNGDDLARAYKILLYGGPDSPVTAPPTSWLAFTPPRTLQFRATLGQTPGNTIWPRPPAGGDFNALLAQYPVKSSTVVDLEEGAAVDLSFSGIGDDRSTAYGRLDNKGSIAVVFDRVGRVAEVIQRVPEPGEAATPNAAQPAIPVGTIFFLVVPRDVIVSGSNTLASDEAAWVALEPQTGRVFVADNVMQSGTDTAALRAARAKARQGIGAGR